VVARVGDRVQVVGAHLWSGYSGVVVHVSTLDDGITVRLDCGLRATVADSLFYRVVRDIRGQPDATPGLL
jgi:hypothetical protein